MSEAKIEKCPYCGGVSFGVGYSVGQGSMSVSKMGLSGCKVIHTICRNCGVIVLSQVERPNIFKENK